MPRALNRFLRPFADFLRHRKGKDARRTDVEPAAVHRPVRVYGFTFVRTRPDLAPNSEVAEGIRREWILATQFEEDEGTD
jgi:hypothetical protein